jgi:hypothetical protein
MDVTHRHDPLDDARESAARRLHELREGEGVPRDVTPDVRALLVRAERNVEELGTTARDLAAVLPTRVEAAVARALGEDEGGIGRRIDELRSEAYEVGSAVDRIERDLLADRLGRVEDLEVLVDLLVGGMSSLRSDIARLSEAVTDLGRRLETRADDIGERLDAPLQVTVARTRSSYHHLFARTEDVDAPAPD